MSFIDQARQQVEPLLQRLLDSVTEPTAIVGGLGVILLVAGRRLYKLTIVTPGIVAAILLGNELAADQSTGMRAAVILALAIVAVFVLHSAERLAVAAAGAFVAVGLANAIAPRFIEGATPWPLQLAAGVLGLLIFPAVYRRLLVLLTPAIGALCIAWSLGRQQDLFLVVGLTLVGAVIQLATAPGSKD